MSVPSSLSLATPVHACDVFVAAAAGQWTKVRLSLLAGYDVNARRPIDPTKTVTENNNTQKRSKKPRVLCYTNRTLLHKAAETGDLEAVLMLIDFGADLDVQDDRGATPLMLASKKTNFDVVEALLSNGADVGIVTHDGPVVRDQYDESDFCDVHPPPRHNDKEYENIAFHGRHSCLHYAFMTLDPSEAVVQLLLQYGADVNVQDGTGVAPLHRVSESFREINFLTMILSAPGINLELMAKDTHFGSGTVIRGTPLYCAAKYGAKSIKLLLDAGANPNVTDRNREHSPFTLAALNSHVPLMRKLAAAGADVYWRNGEGENALMIAAGEEGSYEAVDELLTSLAPFIDVNAVANNGVTALLRAITGGDPQVVRRVIEAGADVHQHRLLPPPDENDDTARCEGGWVYGRNTVNAAVWADNIEIMTMLLEHKPRVDLRSTLSHQTPFIYCAANRRYEMLAPLAKAGADINATDHEGNTALHWAARNGCKECTKILLKLGADTSIRNKEGKAPHDIRIGTFSM